MGTIFPGVVSLIILIKRTSLIHVQVCVCGAPPVVVITPPLLQLLTTPSKNSHHRTSHPVTLRFRFRRSFRHFRSNWESVHTRVSKHSEFFRSPLPPLTFSRSLKKVTKQTDFPPPPSVMKLTAPPPPLTCRHRHRQRHNQHRGRTAIRCCLHGPTAGY